MPPAFAGLGAEVKSRACGTGMTIVLDYENYQCRIYEKRGLAASISAGDTAGDSFCRALQRRQIIFDQHARRAQKTGQDEQYSRTDAVDQFFHD
jgi:hypothetical protein